MGRPGRKIRAMEHVRLTSSVDRVISVPLSEADWKAFIAATPQPVDWLRARILEVIQANQDKKQS